MVGNLSEIYALTGHFRQKQQGGIMLYALINGVRMLARPGLRGLCGSCNGNVLARCGEINVWHWAHQVAECDPWSEPESEWHAGWKNLADPSQCEVTIGPHRADILGYNGVVIELQHSTISTEEIAEREDFYGQNGDMIWVFDASEFQKNLEFLQVIHQGRPCFYFSWKWPRRSYIKITKPLFFDISTAIIPGMDGIIASIMRRHGSIMLEVCLRNDCRSGIAKLITKHEFINQYIREQPSTEATRGGFEIAESAWLEKINLLNNHVGKINISAEESRRPELRRILSSRVLEREVDPDWGIQRWKRKPRSKVRYPRRDY